MAKKVRLRMNTYAIVARAVEEGTTYGITRLWKYHDSETMTEDEMREKSDTIVQAVLNDLCEVVKFDESEP